MHTATECVRERVWHQTNAQKRERKSLISMVEDAVYVKYMVSVYSKDDVWRFIYYMI